MAKTGHINWLAADAILLVVISGFFLAYGDRLSPRFYWWAGFAFVGIGLLFLFAPPFRKLVHTSVGRVGLSILGLGAAVGGAATLSVQGMPSLARPEGKALVLGFVMVVVGGWMVALEGSKQDSAPTAE